jgi:hypothetical protein
MDIAKSRQGIDAWFPRLAVRQLPNGRWTSKLGDFKDIEHDTLDGFEEQYGRPRFWMRMRTTERI